MDRRRRPYLICTTPRSGSTFLSEALASTGVAGRPEEYFQQLADTGLQRRPVDYLGGSSRRQELPSAFSAPDGDFRVELMFDPRRFASFGDYATWVHRHGDHQQRRVRRQDHVRLRRGPRRGAARRARRRRARDDATRCWRPRFPRLRYVRLVRAGQGEAGRVAVARDPDVAVARGRRARRGRGRGGAGLRYSFPALDRLRRGLLARGGRGGTRTSRTPASRPLTVVYEEFAGRHDQRRPGGPALPGDPVRGGVGPAQPDDAPPGRHALGGVGRALRRRGRAVTAGEAAR